MFAVVRRALDAGKQRFGFALVHLSVQSNHLHLIAEVEGRGALFRGMQGLTVRLARAINGQVKRRGRLFPDRYHYRALKTPRRVRLGLRYLLLNARKHERAGGCRAFPRAACLLGSSIAIPPRPGLGGSRARLTWHSERRRRAAIGEEPAALSAAGGGGAHMAAVCWLLARRSVRRR